MGAVIELVMLFAALLTDVLLGNYGFAPCLTMFVLFHSSRCVSLRFATIGSLILGTLIDLWYDRAASGTPLWYVLALYAGQAALFRRDDDGTGRVMRVVLPGAAVGAVLTLRWMLNAGLDPEWKYWSIAFDLLSGAAAGVLKLALVVLVTDFICGYLGVRGFFVREREVPGVSEGGRRRLRQVRAEKVRGRRS